MKRVIIVDDALDLGRVLQTLMQTVSTELSITVAPSAEEAVLEAGRKPVDLLVSDIRLPGISGLELVKKIRARNPEVKVIFITALSDGPVVRQARGMNVDGFFFKPLDFSDFLAVVRKCLGIAPAPAAAPARPPAPTPAEEVESKPERLADLITGLRQNLGALAVFVLDDSGRILAQAGDLPRVDLEAEWAPSLFTALSAAAKVVRLIKGQEGGHAQAYTGQDFDLVMSSIGMLALVVVLKKGRASLRMALSVEEVIAAHKDLKASLGDAGVSAKAQPVALPLEPEVKAEPVPEPAAPAEPEPDLEALESMIKQSSGELKPEDVDAFWDSVSEEPRQLPETPDVISYDQAARLGLAPTENQNS